MKEKEIIATLKQMKESLKCRRLSDEMIKAQTENLKARIQNDITDNMFMVIHRGS